MRIYAHLRSPITWLPAVGIGISLLPTSGLYPLMFLLDADGMKLAEIR